jgi:hypothetical protein
MVASITGVVLVLRTIPYHTLVLDADHFVTFIAPERSTLVVGCKTGHFLVLFLGIYAPPAPNI